MSIKCLLFIILFNISFINSIRLIDNNFFDSDIQNLIRKIHRLSISKDEALMDILLNRLRYYILHHDLEEERKEINRETFKDMIKIKANFTVDKDGTYDILSHEEISFDRGYQVSFEREYDSYSYEDYDELVYKMSLISDNHAYLGVYESYPEISFHFDDYDLANVIGILFNQKSIWDWSIMEDIKNPYLKEFE